MGFLKKIIYEYDAKNVMLIILSIVILSMLVTFLFAFRDGNSCLSNPLVYGVQKVQRDFNPEDYGSKATGKMFCGCSFENPSLRPFYFDNESISTYDQESEPFDEELFLAGP